MAVFGTFILLLEQLERAESVQRRVFRDRENAFNLPDKMFIKYFRLDKEMTCFVTESIKSMLPSEGLSPHLRVLVALRFFATGSYQQAVANDFCLAVSQQSVSRCIRSVSRAITHCLMPNVIKYPSAEEQSQLKRRFFNHIGIPGIVGSIDCTHVAIIQPAENTEASRPNCYFNRKQFYSINVQLIVDDHLKIRAVNAKYPGCVHDAFIWKHSGIRRYIQTDHENGNTNSWLLGDSGYPLEPWLLTPYPYPTVERSEELYNNKHASGRNCVERCNGVLKSRFRCLLKHRVLHYQPTDASFIINACAVLHNLCNAAGLEFEYFEEEDDWTEEIDINYQDRQLLVIGREIRQQITRSFI